MGNNNTGEFWDPTILSNENLNTVPVPNNPHRVIGEIDCCTTFQEAVKQICSKDHHMPVPIRMHYDEAHVDRNSALGASSFLATVGFIQMN